MKADIESGSVRQDSLETLISLLSKHTDQRFVKVAKEMKKQVRWQPLLWSACAYSRVQADVVEGVHKRMDRVSFGSAVVVVFCNVGCRLKTKWWTLRTK